MAIIQISKIQVRSGNLVDLPQLDDAEFGWASDAKKLYIGKTTPNENIEILTSYSDIYFSQMNGSYGNLNITAPVTGQTFSYDKASNAWVNSGGNALDPGNSAYYSDTPIHLGNVSNVYIGGGAIGYILETDGTGNLAWTPKGTISANIADATQANPVVITTSEDNFFLPGAYVTITNVDGMTELNGNSYYANVLTSNTFALYSDSGLTVTVDGTGFSAYTGNGRAISSVSSGGSGSVAGGSTYSVQYNSGGINTGDANFQWNYNTQLLSITGTANVSQNVNVTGNITGSQLISNVSTGTPPLTVTSTTRVANLDVAKSGIANTVNDAAQPNITSVGTLTSLNSSGTITASIVAANNNGNGTNFKVGDDIWLGDINVTDTMSIRGQGNVANAYIVFGNGDTAALGRAGTGPLTYAGAFSASGNVTGANLVTGGIVTATGNIRGANLVTPGVLSVTGNANVGNIGATAGVFTTVTGSLTTAAQPNVTSLGILTGVSVSGNANIGNIGTSGLITASGNVSGGNITTTGQLVSSVATGTAPLIVTSTTQVANLNSATAGLATYATTANSVAGANVSGQVNYAAVANSVAGANVSGTVSSATTAGTVTTAAQPNITSVSTSFTNLTFANAQTISGNNMTLTTGANTNAGTITGNWSLSTGSKLQATYADLAEYYEADQAYGPGTVLEFGGEKEVTIASDATTKVAGVVSTDPAYVMNSACPGEHTVAIALQGRVPCKVRGVIRKGDLMTSGGGGYARPTTSPQLGTIIGKALADFDGIEGIIEVAVGRL